MKALIWIILLIVSNQIANAEIKTDIIKLWGKDNWNILIKTCESSPVSYNHCLIVHSMIAKAESNIWKNAYKHNIYWNSKYKFNSDKEAIQQFQRTYNKYYYKPYKYTPTAFYKKIGYGITHYCKSEHSSNSSNGCPNWLKNAYTIWNLLKKYL
jgi:hypothetical protein